MNKDYTKWIFYLLLVVFFPITIPLFLIYKLITSSASGLVEMNRDRKKTKTPLKVSIILDRYYKVLRYFSTKQPTPFMSIEKIEEQKIENTKLYKKISKWYTKEQIEELEKIREEEAEYYRTTGKLTEKVYEKMLEWGITTRFRLFIKH